MYLFDLEDFFVPGKFSYHFNPSGFYNGKNSWLSDDSTVKIIWDTTLNAWKLSGDTLGTTQVINTNPNYPPINGNWTVLGQSYSVAANQGVCSPADALTMVYDYTNPGCICDGSINITASGGVPPYQYSYNNGVTYLSTPIKDGLCGGDSYQIIVKDSNGDTITQLIQMNGVIPQTSYTVNLDTKTIVPITSTSSEYTFELNISPPLPSGVVLTFDLNLSAIFNRTPYNVSANSSFNSQVIKNGVPITTYNDLTTETVGGSATPGCQSYSRYYTNYSQVYGGLTYNSSDVYSIKVITNYTLTCNNTPPSQQAINGFGDELGPLSYGQTASGLYTRCCNASFGTLPSSSYIGNAELSGCNCCKLLYSKSLYE